MTKGQNFRRHFDALRPVGAAAQQALATVPEVAGVPNLAEIPEASMATIERIAPSSDAAYVLTLPHSLLPETIEQIRDSWKEALKASAPKLLVLPPDFKLERLK